MEEEMQSDADTAATNSEPLVLVFGDPAGGFRFVGPVRAGDPALEAMTDIALKDEYWWYVKLQPLQHALDEFGVPSYEYADVENVRAHPDWPVKPGVEVGCDDRACTTCYEVQLNDGLTES